MVTSEDKTTTTTDNSRRNILIVASLIAALAVGGLIFTLMRAAGGSGEAALAEQRLENALRPGDPQFEEYRSKIVLDAPEAMEGTRPVGDVWMELSTTVRNFTGRTITGLELKGTVVDLEGQPVKERTVLVIPARQATLDNNKTMPTRIVIDSISKDAVRANIRMDVAAIKLQ